MLDYFCIFTRGGFVLWTFQLTALKGSPIDALIQTCLLQERSGETSFQYNKDSAAYTLKWSFHNDLGLVFVAVYQRMLQLLYVDELLETVKSDFSAIYTPRRLEYPEFGNTFKQLLLESEERAKELKRPKQAVSFENTKKGKQVKGAASASTNTSKKGAKDTKQENGGAAQEYDEDGDGSEGSSGDGENQDHEEPIPSGKDKSASSAFDVTKLKKRTKTGAKNHKDASAGLSNGLFSAPIPPAKKASGADSTSGTAVDNEVSKKKRANRKWDSEEKREMKDFSKPLEDGDLTRDIVDVSKAEKSLMDAEEEAYAEEDEESESDEEEVAATNKRGPSPQTAASKQSGGWLSSIFQSVAGKATLESSDLEPSLKALKERLMSKNVAEEIAEKLCRSVETSLVGRKQGSFTRVSTIVKAAMEEALSRILTPKRSVDILRDVEHAREQGRPYIVVFCGVNGVGKSTNLAKVAYWLTQHDIKVMLAACDTFRAGAVEQLRTHGRRLQIPVYEKGYEKDPAAVAKEAIKEAARTGRHAVLVDTAGRMQDNEPLMRALSKLINMNEPDLVLFVGEALVGNDAVDQLSKFNERLADLSTAPEPRSIDGILLTKFDTIDDKVGAALSMVYVSGAPIVFVGCGQTYTDLRRLNPKQIIRTLLQ